MKQLDARLATLSAMSTSELGTEWERAHGTPAPRLAPHLLRLGIAWRLQEKKLGGWGVTPVWP